MKNVLWGLLLSSVFAVSGCALILVGSSGENSVRSREKYEDPGEWLKIAPKPNLWLENDEWLNSENWGGVSDRHENVSAFDTLPGEERSSESGNLPAEFTRYQYIYTFCNVRWGVAENVWQTDNREYIFSGLVIKTGDRWDIVPSPYYIEKDGVRYTVTSLNGKAVQIYSNKVRTAASEESLEQQLRDGNCGWLGDGTLRNIFVVGDSVGFAYMDGDTNYVDFPNFINVNLALDSTANNYQLSIQGDPPVLIRRRTYDLQITDSIIVHRENGVELSRDTIRAAAVEIDPAFTASPASGILAGDVVNWNSAYSWGDHSVAGYLTSEVDGSITNEIQNLTIDSAVGSFTVGISGGNTIKFSKGSGGLNNIVEDLTPELGGNLEAGGFNIESLGDVIFKTGVQGGTLKTGTSNADKFELQAYDVDNATYRTVIELDAGNTVRMQLITNYLELQDEGDRTKVGRFDVSGITTGTERTYRLPDSTGKLALLSNIPANQTLSWNGGTGQLSVSGGNTVDLDGRYLESFTESDPIFGASPSAGILSGDITNWNTAFGWGNHATQGYLLSEVDGSTTNELQSLSWNGGTGILTITAGNSVDLDGRYLQTEVDGSITNEGALSVGAGASNTSQILSNTSGSVALTLIASTGIDLTETPGTGGTITVTNSSPDQTVSITGGGINSVTGTYPNFTVTGTEVDGSISNEGSLTVGAGTATTSLIQSNTSGSTPVTLEAGANITLSEAGSTITIAASGGAGGETNTASNLGAGVGVYEQKVGVDLQLNSLVSGNTNALTISEDDANNEIDFVINTGAVADAALTLTTGDQVFDYIAAQGFLTSEVDGSITNEGSLSVGAGAANTSLIQSNTSGSADVTISGGTGVLVTEAANTITVASDVDAVGIDINTYTPTNGGSISVDFESKARKIVEVNTTNITTGFTMNVTNGWNTAGKAAVYNIRFYNSTANVRTVTLDAGDTWYDEKGNAITTLSLASGEDKILTMYTTNGSIWYTME